MLYREQFAGQLVNCSHAEEYLYPSSEDTHQPTIQKARKRMVESKENGCYEPCNLEAEVSHKPRKLPMVFTTKQDCQKQRHKYVGSNPKIVAKGKHRQWSSSLSSSHEYKPNHGNRYD